MSTRYVAQVSNLLYRRASQTWGGEHVSAWPITRHPSRILPDRGSERILIKHGSDFGVSTLEFGRRSAFTLIEIMIVVAIMAVLMGMTIPFARSVLHKEALNKAIDDIREVCQSARTLAIMRGSMTEVVFHGRDGTFEVAGAGGGEAKHLGAAPQASGMSGKLDEDLAFAALRINGVDILKLGEADVARVRFYPNGTCDELRLVLLRSTTGESRGLFVEITTGLVTIESDKWKLAQEIR